MSQQRRKIDKKIKAQIALEAIRNEKTIAQIASEYQVQPGQISSWKKKLLDSVPELFEDQRGKEAQQKDFDKQQDELHRQLGKTQSEVEWLKKSRSY